MKKVLIFSLAYLPYFVSGAEGAIEHITDRIDPADIEFHMITLAFGPAARTEKVGHVIVHRVGIGGAYISKILFVPMAVATAVRLHRKLHFDAIWTMMTYMLFPVALMRLIGVRIPHIVTLQDGDPYEKVFERWYIRPFVPLIDYGFRTASMVQVISKYLATWPQKRGYSGPLELIYNGVHPRDMHNDVSPQDIEKVKVDLGKKEGDVYLLNSSRLVHQKGIDTIIRALPLLPRNVRLLLTKPGDDEEILSNLARELGVADRVMFVKAGRNDGALYRQVADIYVAPSRSEGLGIAFISALAARMPLVATQVGGMADYVYDKAHNPDKEPTAWVVEPDSPEQIAAKVSEILAHPDLARSISDHARRMTEERYNWDTIAVQMRERVFEKVFKANNSASLVARAECMAEHAHDGQIRKTDTTPYIEHPRAVAGMLAARKFPDTVIAAAWVHDVVEDTSLSLKDVERELGADVAKIVAALTEDKSLSWEERKTQYIESVRHASNDVKAISIADKIHNMQCLIDAHARHGSKLWEKFNRAKDKKVWFEESMLKMFRETWRDPLIADYERLITTMKTLD